MHDTVPDLRRQRRWQLGGLLVGAAVVAAVGIAIGSGHGPKPLIPGHRVPDAHKVTALFAGLTQQGNVVGSPTAPVTLIEYGDLQCPVCAQFAHDALPGLITREVRPGHLRIEFRALTFIGSDSARAARMALALGEQGRLWQFADLMYDNQLDENSGYVTDVYLRILAGAIPGADTNRALAARSSAAVGSALAADKASAKRLGINSTPSFLVGPTGGALRGFSPSGLDTGSFTGAIQRVLDGRSP